MTTTSLIFKDPIYGVNGPRFFPGSCNEAENFFIMINSITKNYLERSFSIKTFLAEPETWSGAEALRFEAKDCTAEPDEKPDEEYYSQLVKYFLDRYTPLAHWTPLELWVSLFYKQLCYQTSPYKGALCDIECEAYDITKMNYRMEIKENFLNGNIASALMYSGFAFSVKEKDKDSPVNEKMFFYLFNCINYNSKQRNEIKQEISLLFQRNPWIFNSPENKEALMNFLLIQLKNKEKKLIQLRNITKDTLEETVNLFSETLLFFFTLGFPELDRTPFKDFIFSGLLQSFQKSSEKDENISK